MSDMVPFPKLILERLMKATMTMVNMEAVAAVAAAAGEEEGAGAVVELSAVSPADEGLEGEQRGRGDRPLRELDEAGGVEDLL